MKTRRNISTVCRDRLEAEEGSTALREACMASIKAFARLHRLNTDEARYLLLDTGITLPRKAAA